MEYTKVLEKLQEIESSNFYRLTDLKNCDARYDILANTLTVNDNSYSLSELAFNQFLERNKLRCPAFTDDVYSSEIFNEIKEKAINYALNKIVDKCLIYKNEDTINAVLSEKYRIMPSSELFKKIYKQLEMSYKFVRIKTMEVNECYTYITFEVWDKKIENIQNVLDITMFNPSLEYVFITSSVGLSGAKLIPVFKYFTDASETKNMTIPLASPVVSEHKGNENAEKFADKMTNQNKFITETPELIKMLKNKSVRYPVHCLINVADRLGITAHELMEVLPMASAEFRASENVNAFEIYLYLNSVIKEDKEYKTLTDKFDLIEKTSKALSILSKSLKEVDIPKIRWVRLKVYADDGQDFIPDDDDNDINIPENKEETDEFNPENYRQVSFFNLIS